MEIKKSLELQKDVSEEIQFEPNVIATDIGVIAKDGVITLTGTAGNLLAKLNAERVALWISRKKAVANDIEVKLPGDKQRSVTNIPRSAYDILNWNVATPNDLQVTVESGWVTLEGKVEWQYQKKAAENSVHQLTGAKGITNHIIITPQVSPFTVREKIEEALQRNAIFDSRGIQVEAHGAGSRWRAKYALGPKKRKPGRQPGQPQVSLLWTINSRFYKVRC